jgi:Subtilase family
VDVTPRDDPDPSTRASAPAVAPPAMVGAAAVGEGGEMMLPAKHVILKRVETGPARGRDGLESVQPRLSFAVEVDALTTRRVEEVSHHRDIAAVAPVIPMKLIAPVGLPRAAQPTSTSTAWGVHAVGADRSSLSGDGVRVAVLDTGIDASHPAFDGVELVQRNFTGESDEDLDGHGTHCAGTIFGRDIDGERIGVAPQVPTALIGKVIGEDGAASDVIVTAIEWALRNEAQVISMSLGFDFPGMVVDLEQEGVPTELATSMALEGYRTNILLFERLGSLVQARASFTGPCLLVAAAGNEQTRRGPRFRHRGESTGGSRRHDLSRGGRAGSQWFHDRELLQLWRAPVGARGRYRIGAGRRRVDDDERNQHGYAACCRGRRIVGGEADEKRSLLAAAVHRPARGFGNHRQLKTRVQPGRRRQRHCASAAGLGSSLKRAPGSGRAVPGAFGHRRVCRPATGCRCFDRSAKRGKPSQVPVSGIRSGLPSLGLGVNRPNRMGRNHRPQNSKACEVEASEGSNPSATAALIRANAGLRG